MNDWLFPEEVIELIRQKAKELLLDFDTLADAVNRALGIVGYSMQEATEAFEKLFRVLRVSVHLLKNMECRFTNAKIK